LLTPVKWAEKKLGRMTAEEGREVVARLAIELVKKFFRHALESDEACAHASMRREVKSLARATIGHLRASLRDCLNEGEAN
jgi:hypothetical protein